MTATVPSRLFLPWLAAIATVTAISAAAWNSYLSNSNLQPGDEVIIHPGRYELTHGFYLTDANITIRSSTGNRDDVVLYGGGMNVDHIREGIQLVAPGMTVKDLTIEGFFHHAIHWQNGASNSLVQNVKTLNIGEQHMKGVRYTTGGIIEKCLMMQTEVRTNGWDPDTERPDNYVGGIDLIGASNYVIRDNVALGIQGLSSGDAAFFLWQDNSGHVVERNVSISCNKGFGIGNPSLRYQWQVQDSIVRNNIVIRDPEDEIGLEACYTKDVKIYNNTLYSTSSPGSSNWFRTLHILDKVADDPAHPTTNLDIRNNIIRGAVLDNSSGDWSDAAVAAMGNIVHSQTPVLPQWFVDAANYNMHLTELAAAAIDAGVALADPSDVTEDFDRGPRGASPDMGADEFASPMGDANYDGKVDGGDFTLWADHYKQAGGWGDGDFTGDGTVDGADYTLWADNFGFDPGAGASPVPGPAPLLLLAGGGAALLLRRKWSQAT